MNHAILPELTQIEMMHVNKMIEQIIKVIIHNKSPISFKHYMHIALYDQNLGYYMLGKRLGKDFITAPMSSNLFGQTFALKFAEILKKIGKNSVIIEFGGGTGVFALSCLEKLKLIGILPSAYYIIENSPGLKNIQKKVLKKLGNYYSNIYWFDELPEQGKLNAIIFANEFIDAMPVELIHIKNKELKRVMVDYRYGKFHFCDSKLSPSLLTRVTDQVLPEKLFEIDNYQTEVNLSIRPWLKSINNILERGVIFICDYGYENCLYYHPNRINGTLQCYFKHHVHNNPLIYTGLQDITAHVDFTAVARYAEDFGFMLDSFMVQGNFLVQNGITEIYKETRDNLNNTDQALQLGQELRLLTLSGELGENFKIMTLSLNYEEDIVVGLNGTDMSHLL